MSSAGRLYDLDNGTHLTRNAIEDYEFLVRRGTPHFDAVARVGHTPQSWARVMEARQQAERRATRGRVA